LSLADTTAVVVAAVGDSSVVANASSGGFTILGTVPVIVLTVLVGVVTCSVAIIAAVIAVLQWRYSVDALRKRLKKAQTDAIAELEDRLRLLEARTLLDLGHDLGVWRVDDTDIKDPDRALEHFLKGLGMLRWGTTVENEYITTAIKGLGEYIRVGRGGTIKDVEGKRRLFAYAVFTIGCIDDSSVRLAIGGIEREFEKLLREDKKGKTKSS